MSSALPMISALLVSGYVIRRTQRLPANAAEVLNRFILDVCLPAAVFRQISSLEPSYELVSLVAIPWLLCGLSFLLARAVAKLLLLDRPSELSLFLCIALGNTSYLGFSICSALLGDGSLPLAAVYAQLGTVVLLATVTPLVVVQSEQTEPPSLRQSLLALPRFPPFAALLLSALPLPHPPALDAALRPLSEMLAPLALFVVGLQLRIAWPRQRALFVIGLSAKLVLMPLVAWGLASLLAPSTAVLRVAVIESAMPAMLTASSLAVVARLDAELIAALIGWGVIASLGTLSLWVVILP